MRLAKSEIDPCQGLHDVTWSNWLCLWSRGAEIMSLQTIPAQASWRPFSKFVFVAALCAAYAIIIAALLYPIYMHVFVFD
jgi:hypothetical protein